MSAAPLPNSQAAIEKAQTLPVAMAIVHRTVSPQAVSSHRTEPNSDHNALSSIIHQNVATGQINSRLTSHGNIKSCECSKMAHHI